MIFVYECMFVTTKILISFHVDLLKMKQHKVSILVHAMFAYKQGLIGDRFQFSNEAYLIVSRNL